MKIIYLIKKHVHDDETGDIIELKVVSAGDDLVFMRRIQRGLEKSRIRAYKRYDTEYKSDVINIEYDYNLAILKDTKYCLTAIPLIERN